MKTLHNQNTISIRNITLAGLLIALAIVLKSYLAINLSFTRISIAWVPIMTAGLLLGPVIGGISGGIADIIGFILYPTGAYFPGFTLAYVMVGLIPGLLKPVVLHSKTIYYYLFHGVSILLLFGASLWALVSKQEVINKEGALFINLNFFIKTEPNYVELTILHYIILFVVLLLLIFVPVIIELLFKKSKFYFSLGKLFFIVIITCITSSIIVDTWAVSQVTGLPILVLLPKRIFTNFFSIPIYTYLVAVLITVIKSTGSKAEN